MMQHIKKELSVPLEQRRLMEINIKTFFVTDNTNKTQFNRFSESVWCKLG